jgi:hypothetical protein
MDFISNLPEPLLIEIFKNCKRILPLTYVCKKFDKIISTSAPLMERLKLVVQVGRINQIEKSDRAHRNMFIKFDYQIDERHYQLMTKFQKLTSIELVRCIIQANAFLKILENIPNLKSLNIVTTFLKSVEFNDVIPRAENLKIISLRNSDELFLKFLANSMNIEFVSLAFQKMCSIVAVQDFFETHKNIKIIDRLCIPRIDQSLLYTILNDLNLTRLNIELDKIEFSTLDELKEVVQNNSIHSLNLYESGDINLFLQLFKNLRNLEIEMNSELTPEMLIQATQTHTELESLLVMDCIEIEATDSLLQMSLRNLKSLKSKFKFSANGWIEFSRRNPNIVTLKIMDSMTDEVFRNICLNFHNLIRLELIILGEPSLTSHTLDFICSENFPKNIQFIEVTREFDLPIQNFVLSENHLNYLKNVKLILKVK